MEALKASQTGVYLAPLRLLAWEIYEKFTELGVPTRLLTGEEVHGDMTAPFVSCTIEMCDFNKEYETGVIDEIQCIGNDDERGWAWTRAFLGANCKELHVCGDPSAMNLIEKLANMCGDTFEAREYTRLCPLILDKPLNSLKDVKSGDCIVAFNRNDLYNIKNEIERLTKYRCAIIYGRLPPGNRRTQAKLFNNKDTGYDILVASNAIGMGLNLNIKRVILYDTKKFNGHKNYKCTLSRSEMLQICGRAGRYLLYNKGYVSALNINDYNLIKSYDICSLNKNDTVYQVKKLNQIDKCILMPEEMHIQQIAQHYPWLKYSDILSIFQNASKCDYDNTLFKIPQLKQSKQLGQVIDHLILSINDKFIFSTVPLTIKFYSFNNLAFVYSWALDISQDKIITLDIDEQLFDKIYNNYMNNNSLFTPNDGAIIEMLYEILTCYNYLSFKFSTFSDFDKCDRLLYKLSKLIHKALYDVTIDNKQQINQILSQTQSQHQYSIQQKQMTSLA